MSGVDVAAVEKVLADLDNLHSWQDGALVRLSDVKAHLAAALAPLTPQAQPDDEAVRTAVKAIHRHVHMPHHHRRSFPDHPGVCGTCWDSALPGFALWPCPTIAALSSPAPANRVVEPDNHHNALACPYCATNIGKIKATTLRDAADRIMGSSDDLRHAGTCLSIAGDLRAEADRLTQGGTP